MPIPIQSGYKFKFNHKKLDNNYSMPAAEAYNSSYGIGYMITGKRIIITPGKTAISLPGMIQFIHKDLYHRTTKISGDVYECYSLKFRESFAKNIIDSIGQENFDSLFSQISISLSEEARQRIEYIMSMIEFEWNNYDNYSEKVIEGLTIQFFITALRGQVSTSYPAKYLSSKHIALIDALHYIEQHYNEDPSLETTANAIHVSSAHLSRLFTSEFDTSYSKSLAAIKLTRAMELLINTNLPITEVASQSGYQNSNYFCDAFKRSIGVSPLKYRKGRRGNAPYDSSPSPSAKV